MFQTYGIILRFFLEKGILETQTAATFLKILKSGYTNNLTTKAYLTNDAVCDIELSYRCLKEDHHVGLYEKSNKLQPPLSLRVVEFKTAQIRLLLTLRNSTDKLNREAGIVNRTSGKWSATETVSQAEKLLIDWSEKKTYAELSRQRREMRNDPDRGQEGTRKQETI
ncbi:hypothetical protein DPMN_057381 [Dreissena polymorpha]|uniref:Uncharacterized protein n=1 Tax=Dreissena polymorpha TaxID=45954 RepID=A0A9D4C003_DREPO|nr:hypothetical protein DPMN_057381 [Dreissena polymorpha]